jgi:hypothetical protein
VRLNTGIGIVGKNKSALATIVIEKSIGFKLKQILKNFLRQP